MLELRLTMCFSIKNNHIHIPIQNYYAITNLLHARQKQQRKKQMNNLFLAKKSDSAKTQIIIQIYNNSKIIN